MAKPKPTIMKGVKVTGGIGRPIVPCYTERSLQVDDYGVKTTDIMGHMITHVCGLPKNHKGYHRCRGEDCDYKWRRAPKKLQTKAI